MAIDKRMVMIPMLFGDRASCSHSDGILFGTD